MVIIVIYLKSKNTTTLPYIDNISSILYKIKYVLIDSFYESSSNLQIEAIFSGCKLFNDTFCKNAIYILKITMNIIIIFPNIILKILF